MANLVLLPQASGLGYYTYSAQDRQYGTEATIKAIQEVADTLRTSQPDVPIGIGDISFAAGGSMRPHQSHRHGKDIDIRPLRTDGLQSPIKISDTAYSRARTELLVKTLLAHGNVKKILFNDRAIRGVRSFPGHDNHLHVEMKS
jgi:murein endopeptidase